MSGYHSDADIPFGMFYGRIGRYSDCQVNKEGI